MDDDIKFLRRLTPNFYSECPLGLSCANQDSDWCREETDWHNCINAEYCREVVEAWLLPLDKAYGADFYYVCLIPPPNFTRGSYGRYMKNYGWAEAVPIPLLSNKKKIIKCFA